MSAREFWVINRGFLGLGLFILSMAHGTLFTTGSEVADSLIGGMIMFACALVIMFTVRDFIRHALRRREPPRRVRPSIGHVHHSDGTKTDVYFVETGQRDTFIAVRADDGEPAVMQEGDEGLCFDEMADGQSIVIKSTQAPWNFN